MIFGRIRSPWHHFNSTGFFDKTALHKKLRNKSFWAWKSLEKWLKINKKKCDFFTKISSPKLKNVNNKEKIALIANGLISDMNTCAFCNASTNLSYEHIPPKRGRKCAKNDKWTAHINKQISTGFSSDVPYIDLNRDISWQEMRNNGWIRHSQNGVKVKTLCENCNNFTGAEYGKAYADWANQWEAYFNEENILDNTARLKIKFAPLRLVKQVLSCFVSIIHNSRMLSDPFHQKLYGNLVNEIVGFISDATKKRSFDKKISIFAHLTKNLNTRGFGDWYFITANPQKPTDIIMYTATFIDGPLSYSLLFNTNSIYEPKHSGFRRQIGFNDPILDLSKYSIYPDNEIEQTITISYIEYGLYCRNNS